MQPAAAATTVPSAAAPAAGQRSGPLPAEHHQQLILQHQQRLQQQAALHARRASGATASSSGSGGSWGSGKPSLRTRARMPQSLPPPPPLDAPQLTARISGCTSWQQLLHLYQRYGRASNHIHVNAFVCRLAQLAPPPGCVAGWGEVEAEGLAPAVALLQQQQAAAEAQAAADSQVAAEAQAADEEEQQQQAGLPWQEQEERWAEWHVQFAAEEAEQQRAQRGSSSGRGSGPAPLPPPLPAPLWQQPLPLRHPVAGATPAAREAWAVSVLSSFARQLLGHAAAALPYYSPRQVANTLYAASKLATRMPGAAPSRAWQRSFMAASRASLRSAEPQHLSNSAIAMVALRWQLPHGLCWPPQAEWTAELLRVGVIGLWGGGAGA